jgi:hypothetical protein
MDKNKVLDIVNNVSDKSNKDLLDSESFLFDEYEKTKQVIIGLTKHMEAIEELHAKIVDEIEKRKSL